MTITMTMSDAGLALTERNEGLRLETYLDVAGKPTIGYGHLLKAGESFPNGITLAQASTMLRSDIADAEAAVNRLVTVTLTQNQFDALVDFTYNEGQGHLEASTLLVKLNAGSYDDVPGELRKWIYAGGRVQQGLVGRRADEIKLWLS
jgi:lysozyme